MTTKNHKIQKPASSWMTGKAHQTMPSGDQNAARPQQPVCAKLLETSFVCKALSARCNDTLSKSGLFLERGKPLQGEKMARAKAIEISRNHVDWYCTVRKDGAYRHIDYEAAYRGRTVRVSASGKGREIKSDWWIDGLPFAKAVACVPAALDALAGSIPCAMAYWPAYTILHAAKSDSSYTVAHFGAGRVVFDVLVPPVSTSPLYLGLGIWRNGELHFLADFASVAANVATRQERVAFVSEEHTADWIHVDTVRVESGYQLMLRVPFGMSDSTLHEVMLTLTRHLGNEKWFAGITSDRVSVFEIVHFTNSENLLPLLPEHLPA